MRIKDIIENKGADVQTIDGNETIHDAISKLNQHGIGALVVTEGRDKVAGIITERDILHECGQRCLALKQPSQLTETGCPSLVRDVMTKEVIIGLLDDELDYVMAMMTNNRVRHLPVMDADKLVGIISMGDVVNTHVQEAEHENRLLKDYIHGVTH